MSRKNKKISIVLPVYNEEGILEELYNKLSKVISECPEQFEIIFVNDGSSDNSLNILLEIKKKDSRICILDFTRNFGHHNSLTAGMIEADGDAVILMDSDMEDRPEDLLKFIEQWNNGYEVVYAIRISRKTSLMRSPLFKLYHILNRRLSSVNIDATGIFGLMDRLVVNEIVDIKENNRYIPGLRAWVGFKQIGIEIDRSKRYDESPRIIFSQLYKLAFDSFTAFSGNLLSLPIFIGLLFFVMSVILMAIIFFLKIYYDFGPWGWASLVCIILITSGIQFAFIGLLGEYISRIMVEVKGRPLYIIRKKYK